jgi:hypothetical protein
MPAFDYALVRVVPRVERGEQINVGVIVHCKTEELLDCRIALDRERLLALDPDVDVEAVEQALALIRLVCAGDPRSGAIASLSPSERFHWLTSPKSTMVQTSPVHPGLADDPRAALDDLMHRLVEVIRSRK